MHLAFLMLLISAGFSPGFTFLFFMLFCDFYVWQIALFVLSIMRLVDMYPFYTYLLQIPDVGPLTSICRRLSSQFFFPRKISRLSHGLKSSDALEPSVTLIH